MKNSIRRALVAIALVAGTAALVTPVLAQTPPGPPVCGNVAGLVNYELFLEGFAAKGDNFVSIPQQGPLTAGNNTQPGSAANQTFKQLCTRFGLTGTTSSIQQFNADTGNITSYTCDQGAAPQFTEGQGVLIRPVGVAGQITGRIPGVECSRDYTAYGEGFGALGDNIAWIPLTVTTNSPEVFCQQLSLPAGSSVQQFIAGAGNINSHTCGAAATYTLRVGEALLVRPSGAAGAPVSTGRLVIY